MNDPARSLYPSRNMEEVWIAVDCRGLGAKSRLHQERRAWGPRATVEGLGHGCLVLVVRPSGALELAR